MRPVLDPFTGPGKRGRVVRQTRHDDKQIASSRVRYPDNEKLICFERMERRPMTKMIAILIAVRFIVAYISPLRAAESSKTRVRVSMNQ